jgi:ketosteroid isomerase-like protein
MTAASEEVRAWREDVVRDHMESETVHDFDRTIATFSHPRYELIPSGAVFDGEEEVRRYYAVSRDSFPDQRNESIAFHHTDDGVLVEFWLMGTHKGALRLGGNEIAPTGKDFRVRMAALFLFDENGIVGERVWYDQLSIMQQLGLLPGS